MNNRCDALRLTTHIVNRRRLPLAAAVALCLSTAAQAATITVSSGDLTHGSGNCTLLDAVASINQGSLISGTNCSPTGTFGVDDTVVLKNYTFTFSNQPAGGSVTGHSAILLTAPATLIGDVDTHGKPLATLQRSTVSGNPDFRVVESNSNLSLIGVTVQHGNAAGGYGGGAYASMPGSTLTLSNSTISGNTADKGGGIYAKSSLVMMNSTVSNNTAAAGNGGGIFGLNDALEIDSSTIAYNYATNNGGGVYLAANQATLNNTTVSGNLAGVGGPGVDAQSAVLQFCTIANNSAPGASGGALRIDAYSKAYATIIFGNVPYDADSRSTNLTLAGDHDLIASVGSNLSVPNDTITCNPNLQSLADNGGATQTRALPAASCAIDAGPASPPRDLNDDQRGRDFPRLSGSATDIGAYEAQPADRIFFDNFDP